jgi:hypothetical protein
MSSSIRIVKEAPAQGWNEANDVDEHVGASSDIRRWHSHKAYLLFLQARRTRSHRGGTRTMGAY